MTFLEISSIGGKISTAFYPSLLQCLNSQGGEGGGRESLWAVFQPVWNNRNLELKYLYKKLSFIL